MIYPPQEDSYLIKEKIKENITKKDIVLDIGTGSGILGIEATKFAKRVIAVDINQNAVTALKNKKIANLTVRKSNLFSQIKEKFDLIIFNPPYLPLDKNESIKSRLTTTGGKKGYEIIEKFLDQANDYLKPEGNILLLFSSLTNKKKVNEILDKNLFKYTLIADTKLFFEELFVYKISKNDFLKKLDKYKNIQKLTEGHRGEIYTAKLHNIKIAIKKQRDDVQTNTISNEIKYLKLLNKKNIGPKLIHHGNNYFSYKFISGIFIEEFIKKSNKKIIINILINIFNKCFILDKLNINKEEMHNPFKHIIVQNSLSPKLLDFERATYTNKPKNVTQFCQYVCKLKKILANKKIRINVDKIRNLAKVYKNSINKENFNNIIDEIK